MPRRIIGTALTELQGHPDAPGRSGVTLIAMSLSEPLQVVVDLEQTDETVKGQITVAGAATTAFFGWLELIDRLDRAVKTTAALSRPDRRLEKRCREL